jgi:hypothetical protein
MLVSSNCLKNIIWCGTGFVLMSVVSNLSSNNSQHDSFRVPRSTSFVVGNLVAADGFADLSSLAQGADLCNGPRNEAVFQCQFWRPVS